METKIGNNAKQTSQSWDPHILSYGDGNRVMGDRNAKTKQPLSL